MALTDILEKKADERKREKRLVHLTNSLTRDFLTTTFFKKKTPSYKKNAEYITRSFLDYIFFVEHKEIRETDKAHIRHFLTFFAPQKLNLTPEKAKYVPEILVKLTAYLESEGHTRPGLQLNKTVREYKKQFLAALPKKRTRQKTRAGSGSQKRATKSKKTEIKVGRNDPCPCGSGKKYKKCCGRTK